MSDKRLQTIALHKLVPDKPAFGASCNGCGLCCAASPCPVAMLFLLQFGGECRALLWQEEGARYVCGMVVSPDRYMRLIPTRMRSRFATFFASRIASGEGCDCSAEILDDGRH